MNFSIELLEWYMHNKRELPWRDTKDPYFIWISEVILQQTKVQQGLPYYINFINTFPTIKSLAEASEDKVLKLWQGLGYYSRARNLHSAAKEIILNYSGKFPKEYKSILSLQGIGPYTAAAISSIAFNLPYAVVDGNVIRVLSRFFSINIPFDTTLGKKYFQNLAQELLLENNPATYNQAIMDFGAVICTPKKPDCYSCVLNLSCKAYADQEVLSLPFRSKKIKVKNRYVYSFMFQTKENVYIQKIKKGIWQGLYEFPYFDSLEEIPKKEVVNSIFLERLVKKESVDIKSVSEKYIHKLTHQKINAIFWHINIKNFSANGFLKVKLKDLKNYPISRLTEKYLINMNII